MAQSGPGTRDQAFLCHSKTGAGLFARLVKMMILNFVSRGIFLDVDELENLDNLNFTVRAETANLVILVTREVFTRLWCAVEIISAHTNKVPIVHVNVTKTTECLLSTDFISGLSKLWSKVQIQELKKLAIEIRTSRKHTTMLIPCQPIISALRIAT